MLMRVMARAMSGIIRSARHARRSRSAIAMYAAGSRPITCMWKPMCRAFLGCPYIPCRISASTWSWLNWMRPVGSRPTWNGHSMAVSCRSVRVLGTSILCTSMYAEVVSFSMSKPRPSSSLSSLAGPGVPVSRRASSAVASLEASSRVYCSWRVYMATPASSCRTAIGSSFCFRKYACWYSSVARSRSASDRAFCWYLVPSARVAVYTSWGAGATFPGRILMSRAYSPKCPIRNW